MSEDGMTLEEKVLDYIRSRRKGALQSDIWKKFDIDSRKCSRIITNLEQNGLVYKKSEVANGRRTYRIVSRYGLLMANDMVSPCCGCTGECVPERCVPLSGWLLKL
jgi:DNA-binding MarR family transcriptional regulator